MRATAQMPDLPYDDRASAGRILGEELARRLDAGAEGLVLGLPRGGVVVAAEVATRLGWPLDVVVVRKVGVPWHRELAMGAIGPAGVRVLDDRLVQRLGVSPAEIEQVIEAEDVELRRREQRYRGSRPPLDVRDKVVVVIDDGLATGSTARAACQTLRLLRPRRIVLAAPVGPRETIEQLSAGAGAGQPDADEVVCPATPGDFLAVGQWYRDFRETSDDEVVRLLGAT